MSFIVPRDSSVSVSKAEEEELDKLYDLAEEQFHRDYVNEEYGDGYPVSEVPTYALPDFSYNAFVYGYLAARGRI